MLIVCPNCATSYMIDPAAVPPGGRTVRCARCKATWFASTAKTAPDVTAFVDSVIAEAEAGTAGPASAKPAASSGRMTPAPSSPPETDDDFGAEPSESLAGRDPGYPHAETSPAPATSPEPVAIDDAPSLVPTIEHEPLPDAAETEPESADGENFVVRRQRMKTHRKKALRSSRWTAIVLLLASFNVALIGARNDVVRYLPQTAPLFAAIGLPVNLRHLRFENVKISKQLEDGKALLVVQGDIVSTSGKPVEVPRLRFAARNATGQEVYSWIDRPSRSILGPGERLTFRSQLASPPADASDVLVRFVTAQDAATAK